MTRHKQKMTIRCAIDYIECKKKQKMQSRRLFLIEFKITINVE